MQTLERILTNPPPGVDLTLVGGQALIYWTLVYRNSYPALFPNAVISSTTDIDFMLQLKEACQSCFEHWGGTFYDAGYHSTPEYGYLVIDNDEDPNEPIRVDLLEYMHGINRKKVRSLRVLASSDPRYADMYVLTEMGTLLNRVYNYHSQARYAKAEAIVQLANALAVVAAGILWRMAHDRSDAQRVIDKVVKLAHTRHYGINLYLEHDIDLLSVLPHDDGHFDPSFVAHVLGAGVAKVRAKQQRLKTDQARRQASKGA